MTADQAFPDLPEGSLLARVLVDGKVQYAEALSWGDLFRLPSGEVRIKGDVKLLPPAVPTKIVAVGLNDRNHALEMGKPIPSEPLIFMKATSALLANGDAILHPSMSTRVDFEGEIALVIGKKSRGLSVERALDSLLGITVANDVTARDLQRRDVQYARAKSFDTFCPLGPWILVGGRPDNRRILTRVNGSVRQDGRASGMIFSPAEILSFISHVMTLYPGDVILTGTPSGVGPLSVGDVVSITVEGVGTLENHVARDSSPAWEGLPSLAER
ncbi:MAG: fumarylacetoacetate hydrolase family protein [Nitrospiraceae bacterium]|jgi:2-keto-4-pentenoate hydratase/2-oxohepta-3-ene-1,7-dioic acid hydratase in catechol pathway|nr:fumarylacetoacetate hydrolase family protein [Nitrospiraceae bacterium]